MNHDLVSPDYADMRHSPDVELYGQAAEALGREFPPDAQITFSTDMGNVSQVVPSLHPTIKIDAAGASNHEPEFAEACINKSADLAVIEGSQALAITAAQLATRAS